MSTRSIMVVDDDYDLRSVIAMALEMEGYNIIEAENGKAALKILRGMRTEDLPGCILLDLMMPEMDGKTFLETVQKEDSDSIGKIPAILATAKGCSHNPVHFPDVAERIQKPMDLDELYRVVGKHFLN